MNHEKSLHKRKLLKMKTKLWDFPGGPVVENLPSNAGNTGCVVWGWPKNSFGVFLVTLGKNSNELLGQPP